MSTTIKVNNSDGHFSIPTFLVSLLLLVSTQAYSLENSRGGAFGRLELDLLSEPESLDNSLQNWGENFGAGERQWAVAIAELGLRVRGFEISVQQRAQLDLRINESAAEFYGRLARKEALQEGESVPLDIQVNTFSAEGLRLGYRAQGFDWQLGGGLAYLKAEHLISGTFKGQLTALSDRDYDLDARVDYSYYRDPVFKRPLSEEPQGRGLAFDLAGAWKISERWQLSASAEDLFARITWENAPYTQARAHTDQKIYDENGYVVIRPFITGREGFHDYYEQELPARYKAQLQYSRDKWTASLHRRHQFDYSLSGIGLGYQSEGGQSLNVVYWPQLGSTALQFDIGRLQAQLSLDARDWEEAKRATFSLRYGF